jgi:hypothetical protein
MDTINGFHVSQSGQEIEEIATRQQLDRSGTSDDYVSDTPTSSSRFNNKRRKIMGNEALLRYNSYATPSYQHCTDNKQALLLELGNRRLRLEISTNIHMLVQFQNELDRLMSTITGSATGTTTNDTSTRLVQSQEERVVPRRDGQAGQKKEDEEFSSHEEYDSSNLLCRRRGCSREIKSIQRQRHIQTPTNEQEGPTCHLQNNICSKKSTTTLLSRINTDMSIIYSSASRNDITSNHHYDHHQERRVFDQGRSMFSVGADDKSNECNLLEGSAVRERVNLLVTKTQNLLKTIQLDQRSLLSNLLTSSQAHSSHHRDSGGIHNKSYHRFSPRTSSTSSFSWPIDITSLSHYHHRPLNKLVRSTHSNHPTFIGGCAGKTPHYSVLGQQRGALNQHHEYQRTGVSFPLAIKENEAFFSNFMCFVRSQCIEVFEASDMDVQRRRSSRPVKLNQVGIRCRFCSHLKQKKPQSSSFPPSLERLYHGVVMMTCKHFANCSEVPDEIRKKYDCLKKLSKRTDGNKNIQYWVFTAKMKGLVDTPPELELGIRLRNRE